MATKKVTEKVVKTPAKTKAVAEGFKVKAVGQNLIVTKGEEKYSRKIADKVERDHIKQLIAEHTAKPTVKKAKEIIALMEVDTAAREVEKKEVKKEVAKKVTSKKPPVEKVESKEDQIEAAKKLLAESGFNVTAKEAPRARRYGGEH